MVLIENARLKERRLEALRAKRRSPATVRPPATSLPNWAADVLVQVGMTRDEIAAFEAQVSDEDAEHASVEAAIDELQATLFLQGEQNVGALETLAQSVADRLRRNASATRPGAARRVVVVERGTGGLQRVDDGKTRRVG